MINPFRRWTTYSPLELGVAAALFALVLLLGVLNLHFFAVRKHDQRALVNYEAVKAALVTLSGARDSPDRIFIRNRPGPGALPRPLEAVKLDEGVNVSIFYLNLREDSKVRRSLVRVELYHEGGVTLYRYVEQDGRVSEQAVQKLSF